MRRLIIISLILISGQVEAQTQPHGVQQIMLAAANAEIATLKAENEKLKAPPKAADKSKP